MATRFYLPSTGTAPLGSLAYDASWGRSEGFVRRPTDITKSDTSLATDTRTWGATATDDWVWIQFQSKRLAADYSWTTADTVSMSMRCRENANQVDSHLSYVIRVVSGDGSTVRGTIGVYQAAATEFTTTLSTKIHNARTNGASNFSSQAGDRIIIEIGVYGVTPTADTVDIRFGDPSATNDCPLSEGDTNDYCGWVELSRTVSFVLTDNQLSYTKGKDTYSGSKSAYTEGTPATIPASDIQNAYTKGLSTYLDNQNAYTQGKLNATPSKIFAYTRGGVSVLDNQYVYTQGKDTSLDNQYAYTQGNLGQIDNQYAYTKGKSDYVSDKDAYTFGITAASDKHSVYTEGYTVGGPASSSKIVFTMGLGSNNLSPDGDISVSGIWWNELNNTNNLYQSIDETTPNDNDYIWDTNPTTGHYYECSLNSPVGIPGSGQITIFYRGKDSSNSGKSRANVQLRQGGTVIASGTQILTSTPQTYYFQLSEAERANITDWNDLRIRILPQIS